MARKTTFTKAKFEERLLQQINVLLRGEFKDPRLVQVTVTSVELSQDYSYAKVMWDTFDKAHRGDAKAAIEGISGKLRTRLAKSLDVRHTPQLKFEYNAQFEAEHHISQVLKRAQAGEMDDDIDNEDGFDDDDLDDDEE